MAKLEVTDHVINYRPVGNGVGLMPTWGLTTDGTRIGTVWETERGYAGQLQGVDFNGRLKEYACPELTYRDAVIEHLDIQARKLGLIP